MSRDPHNIQTINKSFVDKLAFDEEEVNKIKADAKELKA